MPNNEFVFPVFTAFVRALPIYLDYKTSKTLICECSSSLDVVLELAKRFLNQKKTHLFKYTPTSFFVID